MRLSSCVPVVFAAIQSLYALQIPFTSTSPSTNHVGVIFETAAFWNRPSTPEPNEHFFEDAIKLGWEKVRNSALEEFERAKHIAEENNIMVNIEPLKTKISLLVATVQDLRESIFPVDEDEGAASLAYNQDIRQQAMGVDVESFSNGLERLLEDAQRSLEAQFPSPDETPSHMQRVERIAVALSEAEEAFVRLSIEHGVEEDRSRESFRRIRPIVQDIVVIAGDLAEQHAALLEAVLIGGIMLILPESIILRPLLGLFGWGPYGPVKGSVAAWAQRFFFGPMVPKGSWFSGLQRWGMTEVPGFFKSVLGWIRGAFKAIAGNA